MPGEEGLTPHAPSERALASCFLASCFPASWLPRLFPLLRFLCGLGVFAVHLYLPSFLCLFVPFCGYFFIFQMPLILQLSYDLGP